MNEIKLVAIDLDGTLLDDHKVLSSGNRKALEQAIDRGTVVGLVSARDWASIAFKVPIKYPGLYILGSGGSMIIHTDTDSVVWEKYLASDQVEEGFGFLRKYNHPVFLNSVNDYWVDRFNSRVAMIEERYNLTAKPFKDLSDVYKKIMRVSLAAPVHVLGKAASEAKAKYGDQLNISLASPDWLDLLPKGAGKGSALKKLQNILSIKPSHTMAIGDYDCDIELFEFSFYRVAMGNAGAAVKSAANYITADNNHDGVAQALEINTQEFGGSLWHKNVS